MNSSPSQQLKRESIGFLNSLSSHGFTLGLDFVGGVPTDIISTWPDDWLEHYQNQDFLMHDPVVLWGAQYEGIMSWDELRQAFPNPQVDVIAHAREFGIKNGSVIALTVNRKKTILGISHSQRSLSASEQNQIIGTLSVLAFRTDCAPEVSISKKAQDYLQLVAHGHSDQEIAEMRGVTTGAMYQLRNRVFEKLQVDTIAQAVLKAYKSRIID